MSQNKAWCAVVLVVGALAAGCSDASDGPLPDPTLDAPMGPAVSDACTDALATLAAEWREIEATDPMNSDAFAAIELPPLSACQSAEEWMQGVRNNPDAVGLTVVTAEAESMLLDIRCGEAADPDAVDTPVCKDARAVGLAD